MGINLTQAGFLLVAYIGVEALNYRYCDDSEILALLVMLLRAALGLALFISVFIFLGGL